MGGGKRIWSDRQRQLGARNRSTWGSGAGFFINGLTLPDGTAFLAKGDHDAFVVSYDGQHALECAWVLGGIDSDDATGAVADSDGGVIATGTFEQTLVIEDGKPERAELVSDKGSTDIFLVRYK